MHKDIQDHIQKNLAMVDLKQTVMVLEAHSQENRSLEFSSWGCGG